MLSINTNQISVVLYGVKSNNKQFLRLQLIQLFELSNFKFTIIEKERFEDFKTAGLRSIPAIKFEDCPISSCKEGESIEHFFQRIKTDYFKLIHFKNKCRVLVPYQYSNSSEVAILFGFELSKIMNTATFIIYDEFKSRLKKNNTLIPKVLTELWSSLHNCESVLNSDQSLFKSNKDIIDYQEKNEIDLTIYIKEEVKSSFDGDFNTAVTNITQSNYGKLMFLPVGLENVQVEIMSILFYQISNLTLEVSNAIKYAYANKIRIEMVQVLDETFEKESLSKDTSVSKTKHFLTNSEHPISYRKQRFSEFVDEKSDNKFGRGISIMTLLKKEFLEGISPFHSLGLSEGIDHLPLLII